MEVTIEKLRMISDQFAKPKAKKKLSEVAEDKKPVVPPKAKVKTVDLLDKYHAIQAYTIHVDSHRILTQSTNSDSIAARWIKQLLGSGGDKIVVGVSVNREFLCYKKGGLKDMPYDLIQLCVGSHCLIYEAPQYYDGHHNKCPLRGLFSDPRVIAAGVNMNSTARKLFKDLEIKVSNVLDLNEMAMKVLDEFGECYLLDMKKYDLDTHGTMVLGHSWYIDRTEAWVEWLGMEKVKQATYDTYLSYMIEAESLELKDKPSAEATAKK